MAKLAVADDMTDSGGYRRRHPHARKGREQYVQHADIAQAATSAAPELPVVYDARPADTAAAAYKPAETATPAKASDASKPSR